MTGTKQNSRTGQGWFVHFAYFKSQGCGKTVKTLVGIFAATNVKVSVAAWLCMNVRLNQTFF